MRRVRAESKMIPWFQLKLSREERDPLTQKGKGRGGFVENNGMGQFYPVSMTWQPASSGHIQEEAGNWNSREKTDFFLKKG